MVAMAHLGAVAAPEELGRTLTTKVAAVLGCVCFETEAVGRCMSSHVGTHLKCCSF